MKQAGGHTGPMRTCVGCGKRDLQSALLRLQIEPSGTLIVADQPLHGRSAYLHDAAGCVSALAKSRGLRRALRADVARTARAAIIDSLRSGAPEPVGHGVRR